MKFSSLSVVSGLLLVAVTFSGCETPGQGAATGAIAGAVIGAIAGNDLRSTAIGAGAGAAVGAVAGKVNQDDRRNNYPGYHEDRAYARGETEPYRVASPANRDGYVISPYKPYRLIDVRGMRSGARVQDPVSGKIFINP
jgi:hypothetical protein